MAKTFNFNIKVIEIVSELFSNVTQSSYQVLDE